MSTIRICFDRDVECGSISKLWCDDCPKKRKNNIRELPQATIESSSKVLRSIADEIDYGDYGKVEMTAVVIINSEGRLQTFGAAGAIDCYRAIALFDMARDSLVRKMDVGSIE